MTHLKFPMLEAQELAKNRALQQWRVEDSIELYGIRNWGAGFFTVSDEALLHILLEILCSHDLMECIIQRS